MRQRPRDPPATETRDPRHERAERPTPRAVSPGRTVSPAHAPEKPARQVKTCSPPPPSPATDWRDSGKKPSACRGVAKFQHPKPARVVLPVRRWSPPRTGPQNEKPQGSRPGLGKSNGMRTGLASKDPALASSLSRARLPSPTVEMAESVLDNSERPNGSARGSAPPTAYLANTSPRESMMVLEETPDPLAHPPLSPPGACQRQSNGWVQAFSCDPPPWAAMPRVTSSPTGSQTSPVPLGNVQKSQQGSAAVQAPSPPRLRLSSGKGLVWPSLDLTWGEGPGSSLAGTGQPWDAVSQRPGPIASQVPLSSQLVGSDAGPPGQTSAKSPQSRGLVRSSSLACASAAGTSSPCQKGGLLLPGDVAEPRAVSPSGARISSLVRSSSTPLVGQSRFSAAKASYASFHPRPV